MGGPQYLWEKPQQRWHVKAGKAAEQGSSGLRSKGLLPPAPHGTESVPPGFTPRIGQGSTYL